MKRKILCIDDSNTALLLLEYALGEEGYETLLAASVKEAIVLISSQKPDLILLDLSMPEISGYDFLHMKHQLKLDDVPVIIISAFDSSESIESVKKMGAVEFIAKPIKISVVLEKINHYLNK
jgi:CheY-like chemotaxis protein